LVVLGCPHFSFDEFRDLAMLVRTETEKGKSLHPDVRFVVLSCQTSYALLQRSDDINTLTDFGIQVTLDTCVFHTPMISQNTKVLMTNSGKCAYYAPGELGVQVAFGDMAECVASAIEGHVCRKESAWNGS
jgi:predicted aconitase